MTIAYSVVGIKNYIMLRIFVLELYNKRTGRIVCDQATKSAG